MEQSPSYNEAKQSIPDWGQAQTMSVVVLKRVVEYSNPPHLGL